MIKTLEIGTNKKGEIAVSYKERNGYEVKYSMESPLTEKEIRMEINVNYKQYEALGQVDFHNAILFLVDQGKGVNGYVK